MWTNQYKLRQFHIGKIEKDSGRKVNRHSHKRQYKSILAAGLSLVMTAALLGGCASSTTEDGEADAVHGKTGIEESGSRPDGTAMGRYLEEITDLTGSLGGYREKLFTLENGDLVITQQMDSMWTSKDNGATWEQTPFDWLEEMQQGGYVEDCVIGKDGTVGIVLMPTEPEEASAEETEEESRSEENGEETTGGEPENGEDTEDENFKQGTEEDWWPSKQTQAFIVKPDGTRIPVMLSNREDNPRHIWIKDDGRIFAGSNESNDIYEIKEDGAGEVFLTVENTPQLIQFQGNRMIIDGWGYENLLIYDLDTKEYVEDEALDAFVKENYGDRDFNGGSWYDLFFFPGEDNVLYLAGDQGVHRHVIGGSAMEQIVDASLSTFGNPSYHLLGMAALNNSEFMALFTDARLVHFTYDPTVPTVPSERIKAYSLTDNTMLRQAIAIYQTNHPEVYVEYELGMEKGGSVTRDDALKTLNTEIMAGEGPDLLILDDMPVDSYIEKGLLKDLAPFVDGKSGDEKLYDNIVDAFRRDGKIYAIPCEVNLPTIMGKEKYVSKMKDLAGIADGMEELRGDNPQKDLIMLCSPKAVMKNFVAVCAPAWIKGDGGADREAVGEFLEQMKRIYDAQMAGLPEESVRQYEERDEDNVKYIGEKLEDQEYYYYTMDEFNYLMGNRQVLTGILSYAYAYAELTSVQRVKGYQDDIILPMNGQCSNVFGVQTLAGINASSRNTEHAEGLLNVLLGTKDITNLGFPVNQAAFEEGLYPDDYNDYAASGDSYSTFGYLAEDGQMFTWEIYWFDEKMADVLRNRMQTVNTPYVKNTMLEEAVFEAGAAYMKGGRSLEEAVADVEKSLAIYLSE